MMVVHDEWPIRGWFTSSGKQNGKMAVVFSSIGHVHEEYPEPELTGTVLQNFEHVLFLSDISRSWMNANDIDRIYIEIINSLASRFQPQTISMTGISMGGYSALIMSSLIETDVVLALNPQFSPMWRHVPEEKRWRRYRKALRNHKYPFIATENITARRCLILHGSSWDELIHASRFGNCGNIEHYILKGYGHNMAESLKHQGFLREVFESACSEDLTQFLESILRNGLELHPYSFQLERKMQANSTG